MKLALVQEHIDPRRGGAETSTLEMARHLSRLGAEVTIVCRPPADDDAGIRMLTIPAVGPTRTLATWQFICGVRRACRAGQFDVVHAITPCTVADVYQPRGGTYDATVGRSIMRAAPAWRGLKRIGRWLNIRQQMLTRMERRLLRAGVMVAAVSEDVRQQVLACRPPDPARVRLVFNGVDIAPMSDEERSGHRATLGASILRSAVSSGGGSPRPLVLFVAHNFKLKGLRELLRATAWARSQSRDADGPWCLVVAGRDDPRPYRRLASELGVAGDVRFVGAETPVRAWYAAADLLAHPTWHDPCSRVVLEALSVGLPVVTTRFNGASEVMIPGRHGMVIDQPSDIATLAAAIRQSLSPETRAACVADASRLHERLSMARHARELLSLYEEVIRGRRR